MLTLNVLGSYNSDYFFLLFRVGFGLDSVIRSDTPILPKPDASFVQCGSLSFQFFKERSKYFSMKKIIYLTINDCIRTHFYTKNIKLVLEIYNCGLLIHVCIKIYGLIFFTSGSDFDLSLSNLG